MSLRLPPTSDSASDVAARAVAALAAEHASEHDQHGRLSQQVIAALRASGLLTMGLLARDGGAELSPLQAAAAVRIVAAADASTAWYAAVSSAGAAASWTLPAATAAMIWRHDPGVIVAGSARPSGRAIPVAGGVRIIDGRWEWGSAGDAAAWMQVTVELEGHGPVSVFLPEGTFEMESTWDAVGLRASASHAFHALPGTVVPNALVQPLWSGPLSPSSTAPLAHFSGVTYLSALFAAVALGNAEGALHDITALAHLKTPLGTSNTLATTPITWRALGHAAARLDGARHVLDSHLRVLWERARRGEPRTRLEQAAARAAFAEIARTCADVVQTAFDLAGASAVFRSSPLQRRLRDAHVVKQHYYLSPRNIDLYARVLLDQPLDAFEQRSLQDR